MNACYPCTREVETGGQFLTYQILSQEETKLHDTLNTWHSTFLKGKCWLTSLNGLEQKNCSPRHLRDGEGFLPTLENHFLIASAPQGRPNETTFSVRLRELGCLAKMFHPSLGNGSFAPGLSDCLAFTSNHKCKYPA